METMDERRKIKDLDSMFGLKMEVSAYEIERVLEKSVRNHKNEKRLQPLVMPVCVLL